MAKLPLKVSVALPVLVRVTYRTVLVAATVWLPDANEVGERLATGPVVPDETPLPLNAAVCGLPPALSVTAMPALRLPVAVGLKVTPIVQLVPAARLAPQVWVWVKSPLLVPVMAMPLMLSAAVPVLERVIDCAALLVLTV